MTNCAQITNRSLRINRLKFKHYIIKQFAFIHVDPKAYFTLGVEAKGQGKSCNPIGREFKANPKSFRLGVKANN